MSKLYTPSENTDDCNNVDKNKCQGSLTLPSKDINLHGGYWAICPYCHRGQLLIDSRQYATHLK